MHYKKIVIIDEHIKTKSGHYYTYNKSTFQAFIPNGFNYALYGNAALLYEIGEELNGVNHFNFNTSKWYRKIPILGALLYRAYFWRTLGKQLKAVLAKEGNTGLLFFPNVYWYNILPYTNNLFSIQQPTTLLLRNSINEFNQEPKLFRSIIKKLVHSQLKKLASNKFINIVSDSEVISNEYNGLNLGSTCTTLPIPHVQAGNVSNASKNSLINLYVPGAMRLEKGTSFINKSLKIFCNKYPSQAKNIQLTTQFFGDTEKEELDSLKLQLSSLPINNEFLGSLSSEAYTAAFNKADIILIVYNPACGYSYRTSGILAEAIAAEKPFITSNNTWMSLQAKKYNIGKMVDYNNYENFADELFNLITNIETEKNKVSLGKNEWLNFHSKQNFYSTYINNITKE
jgi:hypothetical protein